MVDYLNTPIPPIARIPGHESGCYDSCGNYRSCTSRCPARAAWNRGGPEIEAAHDAHDRDVEAWLAADQEPCATPKEEP